MVKGRRKKIFGAKCYEDFMVETILCRKYVTFPAFKFNNNIL